MASMGFHAVSYDLWQHGERGTEDRDQIMRRVFGNFYRHMWPILARTAEDALRVIDWAETAFGPLGKACMGGISMGGDIAVTVLSLDRRVGCAAAAIATPDWLRPGMDIPPGEPDAFAALMYERLNPMTHTGAYAHCPAIAFECGEADTRVPPDGALRFRDALRGAYAAREDRLRVTLHPGVGHRFTHDMRENCFDWFDRHSR
jgi:dienelactone hydrolase